ncbi:MAG: type II secretion system F family protein [Acutalibacteraceae bacterium]|nr:type II secretion system F family protein [Acutalibacteraceae bacterium]
MPKYYYVAVNEKNRKYKNEMVAENAEEVRKNLRARNLNPLSVVEASRKEEEKSIWEMEIGGNKDVHTLKLRKNKMLIFFHQMALMMRSGISLSVAMEVMIDSEKDKKMRSILRDISVNLYNGLTLSRAMGMFKTFPVLYINIIQAGESNGRLDDAFEQCSHLLKKEIKLAGKIRGAMMYPIFLLILTIALVIVMSIVVLPSFKDLFLSFGSDLPGSTKMLMATSDFLVKWGWLVIIGVVIIAITLVVLHKKNYTFAMWCANLAIKVPIIGEVIRLTNVARFANMMATLTESGVNILNSLTLARDVIGNMYMRDCLSQVIEDVKIGTPINVSMNRYKDVFDSLFSSMVRVGEESGQLSDSLMKIADMYEDKANDATQAMTDAMTPAMTVIIAVIVGFVVISVVQAMFGMYAVIA